MLSHKTLLCLLTAASASAATKSILRGTTKQSSTEINKAQSQFPMSFNKPNVYLSLMKQSLAAKDAAADEEDNDVGICDMVSQSQMGDCLHRIWLSYFCLLSSFPPLFIIYYCTRIG